MSCGEYDRDDYGYPPAPVPQEDDAVSDDAGPLDPLEDNQNQPPEDGDSNGTGTDQPDKVPDEPVIAPSNLGWDGIEARAPQAQAFLALDIFDQ